MEVLMNADFDELKTQHQELEAAIDQELARPSPDDLRLNELKRQKLRIKDELAHHQPSAA